MRFLRKSNIDKSIIVLSDLHLGAGEYVSDRRNYLEAFHSDEELVDFLDYYGGDEFAGREIELILNGDFLDFLAVPFVRFFDDEFWSEEAATAKYDMITEAHVEVMEALDRFVSRKNKSIVYILGNHDAEMLFPSLQAKFLNFFAVENRARVKVSTNESGEFSPHSGIVLKHGHEYEKAHQYNASKAIVTDEFGRLYFVPPWGSYYVTRVVNKFKEVRPHVDAVRPVKKFIINGLIYDPLFTIRFIIATFYYFFMVRFIYYYGIHKKLRKVFQQLARELEVFKDYETLTQSYLEQRPDIKVFIVGHTHTPIFRSYADGTVFINTGTWTRVYNLDFTGRSESINLTYAIVDIKKQKNGETTISPSLRVWKGRGNLPYEEF